MLTGDHTPLAFKTSTTEIRWKLVPFRVMMVWVVPAIAKVGEIVFSTGTGFFTVKSTVLDSPPP